MPLSKKSKSRKSTPLLSRIFYSKPSLFVVSRLIKACLSLLFMTLRIEFRGKELLTSLAQKQDFPLIIAFWHDQIALIPLLRKVLSSHPLAIVVSNSRDGHLMANFGKSYRNVSVISVSHNKRHGALRHICDVLEEKDSIVLITPDGPRGPRHQVKPGIIYSAQKSGAKIVAMHWKATRIWQLSSWDKMGFPKPFSKVTITFEQPFEYKQEHSIEKLQEELGCYLSKSCSLEKNY